MNNLGSVIFNKRQGLSSNTSRVFLCAKPSDHMADLRHIEHLLGLPKGYIGTSVCPAYCANPQSSLFKGRDVNSFFLNSIPLILIGNFYPIDKSKKNCYGENVQKHYFSKDQTVFIKIREESG